MKIIFHCCKWNGTIYLHSRQDRAHCRNVIFHWDKINTFLLLCNDGPMTCIIEMYKSAEYCPFCTEIIACHDDNLLSGVCFGTGQSFCQTSPGNVFILTYHIIISIAFKFGSQSMLQ